MAKKFADGHTVNNISSLFLFSISLMGSLSQRNVTHTSCPRLNSRKENG